LIVGVSKKVSILKPGKNAEIENKRIDQQKFFLPRLLRIMNPMPYKIFIDGREYKNEDKQSRRLIIEENTNEHQVQTAHRKFPVENAITRIDDSKENPEVEAGKDERVIGAEI
jgi:hypothetical protein